MSEITNFSTGKGFVEKNTSFLLQFKVSGELLHFSSDLLSTTPVDIVKTFILVKRAFGRQLKEGRETRDCKSDCIEISTCSLVFPVILSNVCMHM